MEPLNVDYIYWTFTAAAQSVAAFVGLLLAGYALVHSLMESARERDETLDEIHAALRMRFHRWLTLLAILTSLAIVSSLAVVFTNKWEFAGKYLALGVVAAVDIASILRWNRSTSTTSTGRSPPPRRAWPRSSACCWPATRSSTA